MGSGSSRSSHPGSGAASSYQGSQPGATYQ
jgi:hypothetical protein